MFFIIEIFVSLKEKTMESHYKQLEYCSLNPIPQKLLKGGRTYNTVSQVRQNITAIYEKFDKQRKTLIEKSIEILPKKYDQIIRGTSIISFGYEKTPYFGVFHIEIEGKYQGEYLFTTVEWYEISMDNTGCSSTLFFNVIHEPQDSIIFTKI